MSKNSPRRFFSAKRFAIATFAACVVAGLVSANHWLPGARKLICAALLWKSEERAGAVVAKTDSREVHEKDADHNTRGEICEEAGHGDHGERDGQARGEEAGHDEHAEGEKAGDAHRDEAASVQLSDAAQANIGVRLAQVGRGPFERTMAIPAMVVERPGRSHMQIAAPLTGVITRIHSTQGETVAAGQPLFDVRLTHEEVVEAQTAFLQTAEELDVVQREIERLEKVVAEGAVAGKTLLERKYEQQKLEAALRSQRQRLLLHGLSATQVDGILVRRELLSEMTIFSPSPEEAATVASKATKTPLLQVESLRVDKGQHVKTGDLLCILADYAELYVQGKAFEQDAPVLENAVERGWRVTAATIGDDARRRTIPNLEIFSISGTVEPDSRAFTFLVRLPNVLIRDRRTPDGRRFCAWRFKPGQRLELLVPIERWPDRIVLSRDALVQDGAESYVFVKDDGRFRRHAVRVEHRDAYSVVLAEDVVLSPGATVVVAGAYQIHLAIKNKAGGAPDPHAGHNH